MTKRKPRSGLEDIGLKRLLRWAYDVQAQGVTRATFRIDQMPDDLFHLLEVDAEGDEAFDERTGQFFTLLYCILDEHEREWMEFDPHVISRASAGFLGAVRIDAVRRLGLIDVEYPPNSCFDADACVRVRLRHD